MTLNESAMIIGFDAYLEIYEEELRGLEDGEIIAKFISYDSYSEMIEETGFEDYSYSDFLGVFRDVKSHLLKSLSEFRVYQNRAI